MPTAFHEDPIPPYTVALEHDGCLRGYIANPHGWGTFEQCLQFIADHLPPRGYDMTVYPTDGGRLRSYRLPYPTVHRRVRLHVQDFDPA